MTTIVHKRGTGIPAANDLAVGEIAIDTSTGTAYTKNNSGEVVPVGGDDAPGLWEQNGDDIYYNDGSVGIGTDSPADLLHLQANNPTFRILETSSGKGNRLRLSVSDEGVTYNATFSSGGNPNHIFQGGGTERMRIDAQGRVGIGTTDPRRTFVVSNGGAEGIELDYKLGSSFVQSYNRATSSFLPVELNASEIRFGAGNNGAEKMLLDSSGRLGIGGEPSRSTREIEDEAESTLANWNSKDRKPTKAELIKRIAERNIGGGDAKLQVAGDGYFAGAIQVVSGHTRLTGSALYDMSGGGGSDVGIRFAPGAVIPADGSGTGSNSTKDLGSTSAKWKDAHFSGTIYGKVDDVPDHVKAITPTQIANWDAGTGGGGGGANIDGRISDDQIIHWDKAWGWGDHKDAGYATADHTHSVIHGGTY